MSSNWMIGYLFYCSICILIKMHFLSFWKTVCTMAWSTPLLPHSLICISAAISCCASRYCDSNSWFINAVWRKNEPTVSSAPSPAPYAYSWQAALLFNRPGNALAISEPLRPVQAFHRISVAAPRSQPPSLQIGLLSRNLSSEAELKLDQPSVIKTAQIYTCLEKFTTCNCFHLGWVGGIRVDHSFSQMCDSG